MCKYEMCSIPFSKELQLNTNKFLKKLSKDDDKRFNLELEGI